MALYERINRRDFIKTSLALGGLAALSPSSLLGKSKARKPNIIFILTDDQLRNGYGAYDKNCQLTPNFDKFAKSGALFMRACSTSPLCSPSRVACLTGQFVGRHQKSVGNGIHFEPNNYTWPEMFNRAGYETGFIGKLHAYVEKKNSGKAYEVPKKLKALGFKHVPDAHMIRFKMGDHEKYQAKDFEYAKEFITKHKKKPFALFLGTMLTHGPEEAPQKYIDKVKNLKGYKASMSVSKAMYFWLDELFGDLMNTVKKEGLLENTIIVFTGDHGISFNPANRGGRYPGDRCKGSLYDGWVPQAISWPAGIKKGQVINQVVQNIDFLPTLLDMAGIKVPSKANYDGQSFYPLLKSKKAKWKKDYFYEMYSGRAVRTERWKYIAIRDLGDKRYMKFSNELKIHGGGKDLLFDLKNDPYERKNLFDSKAHVNVVKDMQSRMKKHCQIYNYNFGEFRKVK